MFLPDEMVVVAVFSILPVCDFVNVFVNYKRSFPLWAFYSNPQEMWGVIAS